MKDEAADGVLTARPPGSARPITADSFRALMAKLGPRKDAPPRPPQVETVSEPIVAEAPPPPIEEAAVPVEGIEPVQTDTVEPPSVPPKDYDWSKLLAPAGPVETPAEPLPEPVEVAPEDLVALTEPAPSPEPVALGPAGSAAPIIEPRPETIEVEAIEAEPEDSAPASAEPPLPVITIDLNAVLEPPELDGSELVDSLSERFGASSTLLRKAGSSVDPFARPAPEFRNLRPLDLVEPDSGAEDVARSLLQIMSAPSADSQPQERALAADTLLRLVPRLTSRTLAMIAERVSGMENPPPMLVGFLLRDPREDVARPLLERASLVSDQDLMGVIADGNAAKQRMIARRRVISPVLADALIATGEPSVLTNLVRNPGAALSQDAFARLCAMARDYPALQAPLATRADTPPPVAFELFWVASPDLRRLVLSRFLTDTETLSRILKLSLTVGGEGMAEAKLPPRQRVEEFIDLLEAGDEEAALRTVCEIGSVSEATARRILTDELGEPLVVLLKALGLPRGRLQGVLERLQVCNPPRLAGDRVIAELQAIFDTLSLTKTRVLLTYWDWAAQTPAG
ncbi:MAG: DUF2336 domain-containing protein [Rhizobiales bacterium]|nr:DUF2336 domain-containing protein [Hyphomicrobiales bacterium]